MIDLDLDADGVPNRPLLVIDLDALIGASAELMVGRSAWLATTRRITVGVTRKPEVHVESPLLQDLTFSLACTDGERRAPRQIVPVASLNEALATITAAVKRSPQSSVALASLLRQTSTLDPFHGLAAEAAVYSTLLGGSEFTRWLARRPPSLPPLPSIAPQVVQVQRERSEMTVTLARPERHNALDQRMRSELFDAFAVASLDPTVRRVELRGLGPSFCSGGALEEFGTATDLASAYLVRLEAAPWRLLEQLRSRVHAYVHGATIGAGIELAAFAKRVTAAPDLRVELPETGMGLVPGAGGTVSIPRRIGRWRAAWLMLTGEKLDASGALEWGLVDEIVATE